MTAPATRRRLRPPTVESLAVATFAVFALGIGSNRISDNSMLVHLRTGMDAVGGRGIPRVDPFSYTAAGHEWIVQSWVPSLAYGWAERVGGFGWVAALQGVLVAVVAWLTLRLARTGSVARTIAAGGIAVGIAAPFWVSRPLLFGLIGLGLTVLVVERGRNPWLLIPVVWFWVNSHGSFPLGIIWIGAIVVGAALDGRALPKAELRYAFAFAAGLVAAVINPLGPKLLVFPLTAGEKREIFRHVTEWQSPDFQSSGGILALAFLLLAVVVVARARLPWRDTIPMVVFIGLGLFAMRNLAVMALVLAPVLGRALAPDSAPVLARRSINTAIAVLMAVVGLALGATAAAGAGLDLRAYPVAATDWLEENGYIDEPHHVAQQIVVGCYFDLRFGRDARVFMDDRVDMFPVEVSRDYIDVLDAGPHALEILDRRDVDAVLWENNSPLVALLQQADGWRRSYRDDDWTVFTRR